MFFFLKSLCVGVSLFLMKWLLIMTAMVAALLPSCVVMTSAAIAESCIYSPYSEREFQFFCLGEAYYVSCTFRYKAREDKPVIGGVVATPGSEVYAPFSYNKEMEEQTVYVMLTPDLVKRCLGKTVSEPPKDSPLLIKAEEWDAAQAQLCQPLRSCPKTMFAYASRDEKQWGCRYSDYGHYLRITLPYKHGAEAWVTYPLAAVSLLVIDIPSMLVINSVGFVGGLVVYPVVSPFLQYHATESVQAPAVETATHE